MLVYFNLERCYPLLGCVHLSDANTKQPHIVLCVALKKHVQKKKLIIGDLLVAVLCQIESARLSSVLYIPCLKNDVMNHKAVISKSVMYFATSHVTVQ